MSQGFIKSFVIGRMWNEEDRNIREWNCGGFGILIENFDFKDISMNEK